MKRAVLHRLACVALLLAPAYALALWAPVRAWYTDVDKLAHGLVFAGVYAAMAWALRWKPWALAALALALGAAVEAHQYFLPGFAATADDWLADAVGIGLACGAHQMWRRRRDAAALPLRPVPHRRSTVFHEDFLQRAGRDGRGPDGPHKLCGLCIQDQKGDAS